MDHLYRNIPYFLQDYLRFVEIVDYLHYLKLLWIIANYLWIICFGFFVDYLKLWLFEIIVNYFELFVDYLF